VSRVEVRLRTPEAMRAFGEALGWAAEAGDRFLLEGPFGAGKTTFVQGLARGLGIDAPVGSPSFVIETIYRGRLTLYHVDLYRLDRIEPALLEELEEHLFGDGVTAVEWADRLPEGLREGASRLRLDVEDDARRVELLTPHQRIQHAASSV
jgi:tRNA threonylcarbamoyladenosine biosynthesis protein TsaE